MVVTELMSKMTTFVLSASCATMSDINTQGSLHQRDPILVAYIRVSLVQGSMSVQLNVVIVAFLINIEKNESGSVEDIHAFIYCKKWRFGQVLPMPH